MSLLVYLLPKFTGNSERRVERHKAEEACDNSAKFNQLCLLAIVLIEKLCASLLNNYGHSWLRV